MNKSKNSNRIVESAVLGNIGHIIIVLITFLVIALLSQLKPLGIYNGIRSVFLVLIFILTLAFWFYIGIRSTRDEKENIYITGIITALVSILPAGFFTILSQILASSVENATDFTKWNSFYLVGGPTLFWHRPFSYIIELVGGKNPDVNGYIMLNINLILVVGVVFAGSIFFGKRKKRV